MTYHDVKTGKETLFNVIEYNYFAKIFTHLSFCHGKMSIRNSIDHESVLLDFNVMKDADHKLEARTI